MTNEEGLKMADKNAKEVVDVLGVNQLAGNAHLTPPEVNALLLEAEYYRRARRNADFFRRRGQLNETDEGMAALADETNAWQRFTKRLAGSLATAPAFLHPTLDKMHQIVES